ncbi:MAG: hypothetical protein C0601_00665 [Candidatus Muiribacterium halophilum]|uniref:Uncharacterized protein n=1 Tax=Muiribacterium halophilum TaxID=2053465 RepID=A0A2N5ZMJ2_MUIH1|nr:MAG: hypothetical protein C0601_00665 [Candidatus Muirbacterium halophilum]
MDNTDNIYPGVFIYKIIFKEKLFDYDEFICRIEGCEINPHPDKISKKESSKGKYVSYTFFFDIHSQEMADTLNKEIYATEGIFNYYVVKDPKSLGGNNGTC